MRESVRDSIGLLAGGEGGTRSRSCTQHGHAGSTGGEFETGDSWGGDSQRTETVMWPNDNIQTVMESWTDAVKLIMV